MRNILCALFMILGACAGDQPRTDATVQQQAARERRADAATTLTREYAHSPLAKWHIRGRVAGSDCRVLLVDTSIALEDAVVEAMHYGTGGYAAFDGGVQRF